MHGDTHPSSADGKDAVRCTACVHYFVTHDTAFPHGCRAMDFKSWRPPMHDVQASSGQQCLRFAAKALRRC